MHCNDPDCPSGSQKLVDEAGHNTGGSTSLALDASGCPVTAYRDWNAGAFRVVHRNDPSCDPNVNGSESKNTPDFGWEPSLALDASGNPVVSYYDPFSRDLRVLSCNDPNCAPGGDTITTGDNNSNDVGEFSSLVLDCPDWIPSHRRCAAMAGNPVVSYYDRANGDLKLLHCTTADCGKVPTATPTVTRTYTPTITPTPTGPAARSQHPARNGRQSGIGRRGSGHLLQRHRRRQHQADLQHQRPSHLPGS